MLQLAFFLVVFVSPWPPHFDGHADGAISQQLSLGGKGEDIGHEHGRYLLLVDLVDLESSIKPGHGAAGGCLGLAYHQRQAVDHKDHIEALLHRPGLVGPLVGHGEPVVGRVEGVHQTHGHMLAARAEGHGLFSPQPGHEILIGPHQTVGLDGEKDGAQIVDDLVCAVRLGGDFGIETDKSFT